MRRVGIIGSPEKPNVPATIERLRRWLESRAEIVFCELTYASRQALHAGAELLFVLGGDGTMIAAVQNLRDRQLPIVGVNLGKLGFLTEFTIEQIEAEGAFLFQGDPPVTRRALLHVQLDRINGATFDTVAVNDCVILAGPPFGMIELNVTADGDQVAVMRGDGLIVATASGSTAHNLSAGGPILEPTAEVFILTPICPHALTFRPLAIDASRRIVVRVNQANEGTTVAIDGHRCRPFLPNDKLVLTRFETDCMLVRNPKRSVWHALRRKLMWGQNPQNGE